MTAFCRSCGAEILWVIFESGKRMPVNPMSNGHGNVVRVMSPDGHDFLTRDGTRLVRVLRKDEVPDMLEKRFTSHFETCPNAKEHRR